MSVLCFCYFSDWKSQWTDGFFNDKCSDSVTKPPKKHHTIPADVLPNDSEALYYPERGSRKDSKPGGGDKKVRPN